MKNKILVSSFLVLALFLAGKSVSAQGTVSTEGDSPVIPIVPGGDLPPRPALLKEQKEQAALLRQKITAEREAIKNKLMEEKAAIKEKRDAFKAEVSGTMKDFQARKEAFKKELQAKKQELRSDIESKRAEFKQKLETQKAEFKANMKDKQTEFRGKAKEILSSRFEAAVKTITNSQTRVSSVIEKLKAKGLDTAQAEVYLSDSKQKLSDAKTKLAEIRALVPDTDEKVTVDVWEKIKQGSNDVKNLIKESHQSLVEAIKVLKGLAPEKPEAETAASSTASAQ